MSSTLLINLLPWLVKILKSDLAPLTQTCGVHTNYLFFFCHCWVFFDRTLYPLVKNFRSRISKARSHWPIGLDFRADILLSATSSLTPVNLNSVGISKRYFRSRFPYYYLAICILLPVIRHDKIYNVLVRFRGL